MNRNVMEAIKLIGDVYEWSSSGGHLHIVIDDWNLEDGHITFCHDLIDCNEFRVNTNQLKAEEKCAEYLSQLTLEERASALAHYHQYI